MASILTCVLVRMQEVLESVVTLRPTGPYILLCSIVEILASNQKRGALLQLNFLSYIHTQLQEDDINPVGMCTPEDMRAYIVSMQQIMTLFDGGKLN